MLGLKGQLVFLLGEARLQILNRALLCFVALAQRLYFECEFAQFDRLLLRLLALLRG